MTLICRSMLQVDVDSPILDALYPAAVNALGGSTLANALTAEDMYLEGQDYMASQPPVRGSFTIHGGKVTMFTADN